MEFDLRGTPAPTLTIVYTISKYKLFKVEEILHGGGKKVKEEGFGKGGGGILGEGG